jgi:hypothetical protein
METDDKIYESKLHSYAIGDGNHPVKLFLPILRFPRADICKVWPFAVHIVDCNAVLGPVSSLP